MLRDSEDTSTYGRVVMDILDSVISVQPVTYACVPVLHRGEWTVSAMRPRWRGPDLSDARIITIQFQI
jgi:hypothetical protein